jgi:hypothetical protein
MDQAIIAWSAAHDGSMLILAICIRTTLGTRESPANNLCILPPATNEHVMSIWHLQKAMILKHLPKEQSLSTLPRGHASIKLHTRTSKQLACLTHTEACSFIRRRGVRLRVRGGGHQQAGVSMSTRGARLLAMAASPVGSPS